MKPAKYDIFNMAKQKGQPALLELPPTPCKDNPRRLRAIEVAKQHRQVIKDDARLYRYAFKHHELCPPVGTVLYIQSQYGIKAKLTVKMVLGGLPGTVFEILPMSEQPDHLKNSDILAKHMRDCGRPGWVSWADDHAWEVYQQLQGRSTKPWEESDEPLEEMSDLLHKASEKAKKEAEGVLV